MPKGRAAPLPRTAAQSRKPASGARSQSFRGPCKACWTLESPQWRKGPDDFTELCNACGTKWSRCVRKDDAQGWADYVSNKRQANDYHLELMNHHQRQLESLTKLLDSQNQLSPPQPVRDWHTSVPAIPVDKANASAPLIFPGCQSSSLTHLQSCPVEGSACPVEGPICPVEGSSRPVEGPLCPVEGSACPVEGLSCPVEGPICPVEGSSRPVEGSSRPVEGSSRPVEGPLCPVEGSARPVEGSSRPVEGPSCPVEGSTPPVRSSACPAESLPGPVVGYPVQGPFHANIQSAEGLRHAPNSEVPPEEGFQHPSSILPVPCAPAAQAASSSSIAVTTPIVNGGLVEADMAAVHGLAGQMEADAVAAAIGLTALRSAPAECAGITSRQRQNAQLTAAASQRAQPQHQRQGNSNKNAGTNSTDSNLTTHHQLTSADFSAKSRQQHQTDIAAAPLAAGKYLHSRPSRLHQTLGALQRPQHHAADHAASCSLHERQSAASGDSTKVLPVRHPHRAGKAPSGFTQQQQTALPARWGCNAELAEAQPASSAELSTTGGFHDDRSQSYLLNNHHRAQSQLLAFSDARAFLTTARTADAGSRAVPDGPEDPQTSMGAGSLRPAQDGLPAFQTMGAAGNALRAVCNGPGISNGTMRPISGASTATCSGLKPHLQSTSRHKHDDMSSTQPTEQIHDSAMPDAIMAEADEEAVSYSRRGRRICLPARFQATPCHDSQEPKQALRRQKRKMRGDEDSGHDHLPMVKKQCRDSQDIPLIPAHCSQPARHPEQPPTRRRRVAKAAGRKPKARPGARKDVHMTQAVTEAADVLMSMAGF